jgi:hypothetical protein
MALLTPILLNFRVQINQNSDLEIIMFSWRTLYNFHQPSQCAEQPFERTIARTFHRH